MQVTYSQKAAMHSIKHDLLFKNRIMLINNIFIPAPAALLPPKLKKLMQSSRGIVPCPMAPVTSDRHNRIYFVVLAITREQFRQALLPFFAP